MAWKETARAAAVAPRRKFRCTDCETVFEDRSEDPNHIPDCPTCPPAAAAQVPTYLPPKPGVLTFRSKAIDYTQRMAEQDYGLTNFSDNQRAGDIAYKGPAPMQGAEADREIRQWMEASQAIATQLPAGPSGAAPPAPGEQPTMLRDPAAQVANFWQGHAGSQVAEQSIAANGVAAQASREAKAQGVDPVGILERGRETGSMPFKLNVVGSCTAEEAKGG